MCSILHHNAEVMEITEISDIFRIFFVIFDKIVSKSLKYCTNFLTFCRIRSNPPQHSQILYKTSLVTIFSNF